MAKIARYSMNELLTTEAKELLSQTQRRYFGNDLLLKIFEHMVSQLVKKETADKIIVDVKDITITETCMRYDSQGTFTNGLTRQVDTTNPDKIIITFKNELGVDVYLTSMVVTGNRIIKSSGLVFDKLKREEDIRRNGLNQKEIENDYLFDVNQIETVADYWYKIGSEKKHIYSVTIKGLALWYEPGDKYILQLGEPGTCEYINSVVEVYQVDANCAAGGIGDTTLLLRECMENWQKTTRYKTRLVTSSSQMSSNQTNVITVASASFTGTHDYKCDDVDDQVQIQEAIDYLSSLGGGTVRLTNGDYTISGVIQVHENITICGSGDSTIVKPNSKHLLSIIEITGTNSIIKDFVINGNSNSIIYENSFKLVNGKGKGICDNIKCTNFKINYSGSPCECNFFHDVDNMSNCVVENIQSTGLNVKILSFVKCNNLTKCSALNIKTIGANSWVVGFSFCHNITSCTVGYNTLEGNYSYLSGNTDCNNMTSCKVDNNIVTGTDSKIRSYYRCENIAVCTSTNNKTFSNAVIISFEYCNRLTVCSTNNNVTQQNNGIGFSECRSVQQCCSLGDSLKYQNSSADSKGLQPCDDTAAGGYNS